VPHGGGWWISVHNDDGVLRIDVKIIEKEGDGTTSGNGGWQHDRATKVPPHRQVDGSRRAKLEGLRASCISQ
jgi:hypothetical protein